MLYTWSSFQMRFIHTADWHLGKPFGFLSADARAALTEARLDAIGALADAARQRGATHVLVAGDVFDTPEPGARITRQALTRIRDAHDLVWIVIPGNHDYARPDGLWYHMRGEAPANLLLCLEAATPILVGDDVVVLPSPLHHRRHVGDPTAWFDGLELPTERRRIGLAHGSIQGFGAGENASNLIAADRAEKSGLAYLALGDWHNHLPFGMRAAYSGTPEPDAFGHDASGAALFVQLDAGDAPPAVERIEIGRHRWQQCEWNVSSSADLEPLVADIVRDRDRTRLLLRIKLSGVTSLADRVAIRQRIDDELAHEVRWLDLRMDDLHVRADRNDLAAIDAHGVLRDAADRLLQTSQSGGQDGALAAAALERLYVEHSRAQRTVRE